MYGWSYARDLARLIRFDQHEASSSSSEVVPTPQLVGLVRPGVVLLDDSLANGLCAHSRLPYESAVPQHPSHLLRSMVLRGRSLSVGVVPAGSAEKSPGGVAQLLNRKGHAPLLHDRRSSSESLSHRYVSQLAPVSPEWRPRVAGAILGSYKPGFVDRATLDDANCESYAPIWRVGSAEPSPTTSRDEPALPSPSSTAVRRPQHGGRRSSISDRGARRSARPCPSASGRRCRPPWLFPEGPVSTSRRTSRTSRPFRHSASGRSSRSGRPFPCSRPHAVALRTARHP